MYPNSKLVDDDLAKSTAITKENMIKKYGEQDGQIRWDQYRQKQAISNSFEYKQQKYGWDRQKFNEYNASRSQTLDNMIARHGEEQGISNWLSYCERQAYTNTKDYFVEKYGLELGYRKYIEVNKRKASADPRILSEKLGITLDDAVILLLSRQKLFFTSNIENEFVNALESNIGTLQHTSQRQPFGKWSNYLNSYVVYDIKHHNCIIEFNGDYWHANPSIYKDDAVIRGKRAVDIRLRDHLKLQTVKDLGYQTLVVWESDYKNNPQHILKETCEWILNAQK
jgi:hypothetical protein